MITKRCPACKEVKEADKFNKSKAAKNGLSSYCKICTRAKTKAHKKANPLTSEDRRKENLRYKYGISPARYDELLLSQLGMCANKACLSTEKLVVDHNHTTGEVRGLLCHGCNTALGYAREDIDILHGLARYIG